MALVPFSPKRFTDSVLYTTEFKGKKYLVKSYLGKDASRRCELERTKLKHWKYYSLRVPDFLESKKVSLSGPHLLIDFIQGVNLSDLLEDRTIPYEVKLGHLQQVFFEYAKRHMLALDRNDQLLVHSDPNTDNILIVDDSHVTIDFEHPSRDRPILEAIAHELGTFSRRALTDFGRKHLKVFILLMHECYARRPEILYKVCHLTLGRNFQFFHRYKDKQKKMKKPNVVTRYDIADELQASLVRGL